MLGALIHEPLGMAVPCAAASFESREFALESILFSHSLMGLNEQHQQWTPATVTASASSSGTRQLVLRPSACD